MLNIKNLYYTYPDGTRVLKDINIKINEGDLVCVIGQNGCGKSTLLNIIDALVFAQKGEYYYKDIKITKDAFKNKNNLRKFRTEVSYLFQETDSQLFCPTVYEEISFSLRQAELEDKEIDFKVKEIMRIFEITHLSQRMPHTLSGGEKRKVALASILVNDPSLILLDEPTNNLDPKTQYLIKNTISELNSRGKTVIISTHDLFLARELNAKIFLMFEDHSGILAEDIRFILKEKELLNKANISYISFCPRLDKISEKDDIFVCRNF